nr:ORF1 [Torque teno felis virus]
MAPYTRRWRRRWRWPRRRTHRRRAGYKSRRFWKTGRSKTRRQRRRVRRNRVFRRRRLVTLFDPVSKAKCKITGQTIGLIARGYNVVNRCYYTMYKDTAITKLLTGGGVSLMTFSLRFLWEEHRHYRNVWSHTNDGFDLALYFGTRVYLKPHATVDYAFFWDTDLVDEKEWDYLRLHPSALLATKNVIFVRSQLTGNNHKTKKVFIKPPSNVTTQWKFQSQWFDFPLFQYSFVMFNWAEPFLKMDAGTPIQVLRNQIYYWDKNSVQYVQSNQGFAYCPLIDTGNGNYIDVTWLGPGVSKPSAGTEWTKVPWANDLPYWLTMWGQNNDFNFNVPMPSQTNSTCWVRISWPEYSDVDIQTGKIGTKTIREWAFYSTNCRTFAGMGPFVQDTLKSRINIPFMYESFWKWGGTVLKHDNIIAIHPTSGQVSVKNPQTQVRDIIYPWDQSGGLLTERALARFLQPSTTTDERRPLPHKEYTEGYVTPEEYDETGSEAEESEKEPDGECDIGETLKTLTRKLQREQSKRRLFNNFLWSLLRKRGQHILE